MQGRTIILCKTGFYKDKEILINFIAYEALLQKL